MCCRSSNVTTIYNYLQTQDDKVKEQKLSNYWQKNTDMFKQNPNFIDGVIIPSPESQVSTIYLIVIVILLTKLISIMFYA